MVSQDRLSRESSAQVHVYRRSEMLLTVTRKHEFLDKCAELETKGKNWETRNFLWQTKEANEMEKAMEK